MSTPEKPSPEATGPEQKYFSLLKAGKWMIPWCLECHRFCFYPRLICPACGCASFEWVAPSGLGTVYSTTVMRRPAEAGGNVNLCLVDLDEGVRMMSRAVDVAPGQVTIGARVQAFISQSPNDQDGNKVYFKIVE